jgi:ATP-binding cassette subfamily C (CFTR/MRP) protein 1
MKQPHLSTLRQVKPFFDFVDNIIQKTITETFKDAIVFTIAHRVNTVMNSDRILVLDRGNVAEFDTPKELLGRKSSRFYSLAKEAGLVL